MKMTIKRRRIVFVSIFLVILLYLISLHGFWPNMTGDGGGALARRYMDYGKLECFADHITALVRLSCPVTGGSAGRVTTTGTPAVTLGALIYYILPISVGWALLVTAAIIIGLALYGCYRLIRLFGINEYVALVGSGLYLSLPLILSMQPFGGTFWGFLLLPTYLFVVWWLLDRIRDYRWRGWLLILSAWTLLSIFALFMDGYSFFMYSSASAAILLTWSWRNWRKLYIWVGVISFLVAEGAAYKLFNLVVPGISSWNSPIDLFRSMGLDVVTLFNPSSSLWWVKLLHLHANLSLWGDGSNSAYNYIGFFMLGLAIFGLCLVVFRKKLSKFTTALLIIGLASFILSLGPSLKVASQKPSSNSRVVSAASYMMPISDATMSLHTAKLYQNIPGLESMRATYRWHALTLLVLLVFAMIGVQYLFEQKRYRYLAILLLVLMCMELAPNPYSFISNNIQNGKELSAFNNDIITSLKLYTNPGDKLVYYPNAVGGNDYLASYITPTVDVWSYNLGGDKSNDIAEKTWPKSIIQLLETDNKAKTLESLSGERVEAVLEQGLVNKVVVPKFDLRWDSYMWPPTDLSSAQRAQIAINDISKEPNLSIKSSKYFYVVELKSN